MSKPDDYYRYHEYELERARQRRQDPEYREWHREYNRQYRARAKAKAQLAKFKADHQPMVTDCEGRPRIGI